MLTINDKQLSFKPYFKNNTPQLDITINLAVLVEEVDEENPTKKFLKRNKDFLTNTLVEKIKETVKLDALNIISFCKENQTDLIGVYENFYRKEYNKFKDYYNEKQEKYLNDIQYNVTVKVSSSY